MPNYAFEGPTWSKPVITWSFAVANGDFSNSITGAYQDTVRAAITRWSQVANITFHEVADSATVNIRIGYEKFAGTQVGQTDYSYVPVGTHQSFLTGTTVSFEDPSARPLATGIGSYYQGIATTLYQDALHEIGHALGLAHSKDPYSVMYPSIGPDDPDLGSYDIQAIQQLYGAAPAVAATSNAPTPTTAAPSNVISVYRFFDASTGTQFLTANLSERNSVIATRPDFSYQGVGLGALSTAAGDSNAVPVYRFFDTRNGSHFFTTSAAENAQLLATRPDLTSEQPSFYEHATQGAGDVPVYRFFDGSTGTHFFTISSTEKTQLQSSRADFHLEGIAFYAPSGSGASAMALAADTLAATHPTVISTNDDTVLIYRFDGTNGRQFLTADSSEGNTVLTMDPSFVYAGAAMGAISPVVGDANAAPVFRFFDAATGDHFLTANATEASQISATRPDLLQEQTAFYEHLTQMDGDVPVYRFFDNGTGTHFYTASAAEKASILATRPEMTQEGIAFYAPSI